MTRKPRCGSQCQIGYYGDFVSRTFAFLLDAVSISVSFTVLVWLFNVTVTTMQFRAILGFSLHDAPLILTLIDNIFSTDNFAFWVVVYSISYHLLFLNLTGQTIGKAILGLRVVSTNGKRLAFWRTILRMGGFFLSVALLGLGFLWVLVDDRRQALHDKIAGTYVIYTWDAIPDEQFLADNIYQATGQYPQGYIPKVKLIDSRSTE